MTIIFYDGSVMYCDTVEIANKDPGKLIVDECKVIPAIEVMRIVSGKITGYKGGVAGGYAHEALDE